MNKQDPHVFAIEDLLDEYAGDEGSWSDDEVRAAFDEIIPDIRACLAVLNELFS